MTDKPPVPGARLGSDGMWYVKHRGRWHLVQQQERTAA